MTNSKRPTERVTTPGTATRQMLWLLVATAALLSGIVVSVQTESWKPVGLAVVIALAALVATVAVEMWAVEREKARRRESVAAELDAADRRRLTSTPDQCSNGVYSGMSAPQRCAEREGHEGECAP